MLDFNSLEAVWDALLSRQPERVREAFRGLTGEERSAVLRHLRRMAEEPDWHLEQRRSAREALIALEDVDPPEA